MSGYAQTNIQLYNQMMRAGYGEEELGIVRLAHDFAMHVFDSYYRPSHKSFLAHLIGTASILVRLGEDINSVCAGLLHSVYFFGDFGDSDSGVTRLRRMIVRNTIGNVAEELVFRYHNHNWSTEEFRRALDNYDQMRSEDRTLFIIKLADIFEEYLDQGLAYSPGKKLDASQSGQQDSLETTVNLAASLGFKEWSQEFEQLVYKNRELKLPSELVNSELSSFTIHRDGRSIGLFNESLRLLRRIRTKL
jgi:(p)ppGpp synthase/HD superfamily hydrolase